VPRSREKQSDRKDAAAELHVYAKPILRNFGSVGTLTQGGTGVMIEDMGGRAMMIQKP
jgi:hypothetical protein